MAPKWERKRSLTFFSFLLPRLKYPGWAAEPLELHRNNTNRAQKKGGVSHTVPSALSNLNFPRAHPIPCMLCSQGVKFLISLLRIYGRQNIRSHQISSTDQKKTCWLHDLFISYNQPLQSPPFHTKNYRNNPHSSWFLKQCVWGFSHLQQFTEISRSYLINCLLQILWVYNIKWRDFR